MNLRRFSKSILFRLLLGTVAIILIGSVLRYVLLTRVLRDNLQALVASQQLALANYVAQDVDQRIRLRQSMLSNLAATMPRELLRHPQSLRNWLNERHAVLPLFTRGVIVFDPDRNMVVHEPTIPNHSRLNPHQTPEIMALLTGQTGIGRPLRMPVTEQAVLPIAVQVRDADGTVHGTLIGLEALAAPAMFDALLHGRLGTAGGFLLISPRDAMFVAASDPAMVLKPTPAAGVNSLHDRAMAGYRGVGITTNAKGVEELSAISGVPSTGWFVVARVPTSEAFSTLSHVQAYVLRNSLIVLVIALLLVTVIAWWLLKPLLDAARQAEHMTREDVPLEPLKVVRDDEVGHLTTAFNRLLLKLLNSREALERIAHHDSLTNLPNRRLLADRLTQALARARRNRTRLAVLFMDLDGFKPINDTLGHEAGDQALCIVTGRFATTIRQNDTLARVGGDEFVLLVSDLDGTREEIIPVLQAMATKCLARVAEPLLLHNQPISLSVSIGIALGDDSSTPDDLLNAADNAMYTAKHQGRGCYVVA